jgi:hypothetical protein
MIIRVWRDPHFRRELLIRGFITTLFSAITYFILGAEAWVWIFPPTVVLLVLAKWILRPSDDEEEPGLENHHQR